MVGEMSNRMKDSGIEWIGEIPCDWKVVRLRFLSNIITGGKDTVDRNDNGKYPFYVRSPKIEQIDSYSFDGEAILTAGDGVGAGKVFHYVNGKFDYHQRVYNIHNFKNVHAKYLYYYMKENFIKVVERGNAKSTVDSIRMPMLLDFPITLSSIDIERKITTFLDTTVTQIDSIIERTKETINDYKSLKQSIITEAVTKGLNKDVEMKDSGIEWIGEIPIEWKISKIKYDCYLKGRIGWQGLTANEYIDEGPYLITGKDFNDGTIEWNSCVHISNERYVEAPDIHVKNNDVLITKDGTIGKVAVIEDFQGEASLNSGVMLIRQTSDRYKYKFLYYVLISDIFKEWYERIKPQNSTILHLYQGDFREFSYPVPNIDEQLEIVSFLESDIHKVDSLIIQKQKLIEDMEAYKKSLIYECVTGKKEII